jgi:predicted ATPase
MNIITSLTERIEDYRLTNKQPCKNYSTQEAAEKATARMANDVAAYFTRHTPHEAVKSANYVVFYVEAWGRWVGCIDMTELLGRKTSTGGYVGFCKSFFTY